MMVNLQVERLHDIRVAANNLLRHIGDDYGACDDDEFYQHYDNLCISIAEYDAMPELTTKEEDPVNQIIYQVNNMKRIVEAAQDAFLAVKKTYGSTMPQECYALGRVLQEYEEFGKILQFPNNSNPPEPM